MTVLAFVLFALALVVMVAVHVHLERRAEKRRAAIDAADKGRQHALYKQHKALTHRIAAAERATAKMVDETRSTSDTLKADAQQLHRKADALLGDPRVKSLLGREEASHGGGT